MEIDMGPNNYVALQSQLDLTPLRQGLQMRNNNRLQQAEVQQRDLVAQLARDKFEADHEKDAEYLRDVEAWKAGGGQPDGLRDLALRHPEQSERLLKAGDSYTSGQKNAMIQTGFGTLGALAAGNIELAVRTLSERSEALTRARIDNSHTKAALDMIRAGNVDGARTYLSYAMSGLVGADDAARIMGELGIGKRAENDDRRLDLADRQAVVAERRLDESERHNRRQEGLSAAAGARAERKARSGGKAAGTKLPSGFVLD
ncbi:hypothetical protein GCM10022268_24000 [Sphingomonas cynarae]|uniref:Uncharacterized protein n=1 Tax=Sphingomonas cynarae TaxID=930197 RepID=A0ABP7E836_9SPHN